MSKKQNEKPIQQITEEQTRILRELFKQYKDDPNQEELGELYDEKAEPVISYSLEDLKNLKIELKELLLKDHKKVLAKLKSLIETESEKFDEIVLLLLRFKEYQAAKAKGIITFTESGNELRNINNSILVLINTLEIEHLK